jgi:hypothetical protein
LGPSRADIAKSPFETPGHRQNRQLVEHKRKSMQTLKPGSGETASSDKNNYYSVWGKLFIKNYIEVAKTHIFVRFTPLADC